jgi:hypothetical protein
VLRVELCIPDHFVQGLIGVASVGMNRIGVPSQLYEETVVVLGMDVRSVGSGTVDGLHLDIASSRDAGRPQEANRLTSLCLRFADV